MGSKKQVKVGNVLVGGGAQVSVQSMLNVPSTDIEGSVKQAVELEKAGCQILRAAIPNKDAVKLIPALKQALCDSALYHASLLEKFDFNDIVLSMKSSTVPFMVKAYELANEQCDYPLHLGVTEAGTERMGIIKSAAGIGSLLLHGIGDTIRVSLTADPVKEIYAANDILKALGLKKSGVQFVSCPTCGRTRIDLVKIAGEVENRLKDCKKNIKVAVMGCVVNGPGEAREADIGIAGGDGCGLVFKKGEVIRKVPEEQLVDALMDEIDKL